MKRDVKYRGAVLGVLVGLVMCAVGPVCGAGGLEFSKDTVFESYPPYSREISDTVVLRNSSVQSVVVDTVLVLLDTNGMNMCEAHFAAWRQAWWQGYRVGVDPDDSGRGCVALQDERHIVVPAGDSVYLGLFEFDLTFGGPVSDPFTNEGEWGVGDSIWVTLVFVAPGASDTLVLKGVREVSGLGNASRHGATGQGTAIRRMPEGESSPAYLLDGRATRAARAARGTLQAGRAGIAFPGTGLLGVSPKTKGGEQ
jgi:hypothetical protein